MCCLHVINELFPSNRQSQTKWNPESKDILENPMHVAKFLSQYFFLPQLWAVTQCPVDEFSALGGPWFALWAIHTHICTHTQPTLARVLSGNYSDVCLLLVIVQGKEKVNCGLWVIDWKQGIICQSSHWPDISATVQTHMPPSQIFCSCSVMETQRLIDCILKLKLSSTVANIPLPIIHLFLRLV